jgi:hypothetical protein
LPNEIHYIFGLPREIPKSREYSQKGVNCEAQVSY